MSRFLIKAGTLIDSVSDRVMKDMGVLVDGDRIVEVKPFKRFEAMCEVVDFSDKTIMPGLFNCHVHMDMNPLLTVAQYTAQNLVELTVHACQSMDKYLNSGVTYVRNQGSKDSLDISMKRLVDQGVIPGPGICASGEVICMTGGHGWFTGIESDGEDACRKAARTLLKQGADVIKIMATGGVLTEGSEPGSEQLTYEEIKAAVDEARKAGKITSSHAQGCEGILNAVRAGITSVEHGIFLTDAIIDLMLEQGTYLVPTLAAAHQIIETGIDGGVPEYAVKKCERIMETHISSFRKACRKGVKIALGTDAGTPYNFHDKTWVELKLFMDYGMDKMEALKAGTIYSAELLGVQDQYGSIESGKKADLIVLEENPLKNVETFDHILAVYKHGKKIKTF